VLLYHRLIPISNRAVLKMKSFPLLVACSLLAVSATAIPLDGNNGNVKRDVDVDINGQPVHIKGGYIRNTDLDRMGYAVGDRHAVEKRDEVDIDGTATRSGWGYIKGRGEKEPEVDVDGTAIRSGWGYIKGRGEKEPEVDVDGTATRSGWGYIKARGEGKF
jgi:hypothetical protein